MQKAKTIKKFQIVEASKIGYFDDQFNLIDKFFIFVYLFLSCFESYLPSTISGITKIVMLIIVGFLAIKDLFRRSIRLNWPVFLIIIWLFLKIISVLWGGYNSIISLHFLSQLGFVLLFVSLGCRTYSKTDVRFFMNSLLVTTFLFSLLSLIFQAPYETIYVSRRVLTLFGKQLDPNNCAAFQAICFAISCYLFFSKKRYYMIVPAVVSSAACFLSGSRAGLITFCLIFIFSLTFLKLKSKYSLIIKLGIIFGCACVALITAAIALPFETFKRLFMISYISSGGGERDVYWALAFEMFQNKPLFGWGWGVASFFGKVQVEAVHNTFLSMLAENGVIGLTLFIVFPVYYSIRALFKREYLPLLLVIAVFLPAFFIDSINKRFIWNIFYMLLLMYLSKQPEKSRKEYYEKEKTLFYRISI